MQLKPIQQAFFLTTGLLRGVGVALDIATGWGGLKPVPLPIAVLVLVHKTSDEQPEITLVDTGWSRAQCVSPLRELGLINMAMLAPTVVESDCIAAQLLARGYAPSQVKTIVATHLHNDHVGGLVDFPDAEVVTSDDELQSARLRGKYMGFDVAMLSKIGKFRMVRFTDAYEQFSVSNALGDEVTLVDLRGHTAGSTGVLVQFADVRLLHVGDAAYTIGEAVRRKQSPLAKQTCWNRDRQLETYDKIGAAVHDGRWIVLPSHDPQVWEQVKHQAWSVSS